MTAGAVLIRPATPADADEIAHVHIEAWRTAYRTILCPTFLAGLSKEARRDKWLAILQNQSAKEFNLVAHGEGRIIGFASGGPERGDDPAYAGELYAIYLLDDFRRRGIGARLLADAREQLLARGMPSMKVWVLKENPYRSFYERCGGVLLPGELAVSIGEQQLIEVAYGWPDGSAGAAP